MSELLVTGATGRVGRAVVNRLVAEGRAPRVYCRSAGATSWPAGVEVATGDLDDPATVAAALRGVHTVFLALVDGPTQAARGEALLQAARRAGVRKVVLLSAYVAGTQPLTSFGSQLQPVEQALRASGLAWTVLRPFMFMQNFLGFAPMVAAGRIVSPFRSGRVAFVDVDDVAAVAARTLVDDGHDGQLYEVTGPAPLSFADAAATLSDVLGRPVRHLGVPGLVARFGMRRQGVPAWTADRIVELARVVARGEEDRVAPTVQHVARVTPTSFRAFVQRHAAAFDPAA